jgi:hypothetical protein
MFTWRTYCSLIKLKSASCSKRKADVGSIGDPLLELLEGKFEAI